MPEVRQRAPFAVEVEVAVEAVARRFSATRHEGDGLADAYLKVGGRRIALAVAVMAPPRSGGKPVARARLRDDAVARRALGATESALRPHVPDGKTLIVTLGAPIRVPKKLVAALTETLRAYLESGAHGADERKTLLDNRVRYRVANDTSKWGAKVIGFVFSGDPKPGVVERTVRSLYDAITAEARTRMPKGFAGERWLVLANEQAVADIKTYQRAYTYLSLMHDFARILMVLEGGRVETLSEKRAPSA